LNIGLTVLLAAVLLGYTFSRIKIRICLQYHRQGIDDLLSVDVYLLNRLLAYRIEVPVIKLTKDSGQSKRDEKSELTKPDVDNHAENEDKYVVNPVDIYLHHPKKWRQIVHEIKYFIRVYRKFARHLQRNMTCEKFYWRTRFGNDDAALTSMIVGAFWAIKSEILVLLRRRLKFVARPEIKVTPVYNGAAFEVSFQCIFAIRVGNVINAMFSLVNFPRKEVKCSERSSDPRFDEDRNGKH